MVECRKEILVQGIGFPIDPELLRHLNFEAPSLLDRIRQFAKGIRELYPTGVELEALGDAGVIPAWARKRSLDAWVFIEDRWAIQAQSRFHALHDDPTEDVRPGIVLRDPDSGRPCGRGEGCTVTASVTIQRCEEVDSSEVQEGFGDCEMLGRQEWIRNAAPVGQCPGPRSLGGSREEVCAILPQHSIIFLCTVPLEHRELRVVEGSALPVPIDLG